MWNKKKNVNKSFEIQQLLLWRIRFYDQEIYSPLSSHLRHGPY